MIHSHLKVRSALALALAALIAAAASGAHAATVPSGEVEFARSVVEPVYNDADGSFGYLLTPEQGHLGANTGVFADIYVVMYPTAVAGLIGDVNCTHQPQDNCPDHGPILSGLAMSVNPSVYGAGVWGHDHLASLPPAPPARDGEFAVVWRPVVVLFNTPEAAAIHITTEEQLEAARDLGLITEIPLPEASFHGSPVSARVYARGVPVPPAPPIP